MADLHALAARLQRINAADAALNAREATVRARDEQTQRDIEATDYLAGEVLAAAHARIDQANEDIAGEMNKIRLLRATNQQNRDDLAADAKRASITLEQIQRLIDEEHGHA